MQLLVMQVQPATQKPILYVTDAAVTTNGTGTDEYYTLTGIVNGEQDVVVKAKTNTVLTKDAANNDVAAGKFYELTQDENGYTTALTVIDISSNTGKTAANGVLDGKAYDGTEKVFVIADKTVSVGDVTALEAADHFYIITAGTTGADQYKIATLYIVKA